MKKIKVFWHLIEIARAWEEDEEGREYIVEDRTKRLVEEERTAEELPRIFREEDGDECGSRAVAFITDESGRILWERGESQGEEHIKHILGRFDEEAYYKLFPSDSL